MFEPDLNGMWDFSFHPGKHLEEVDANEKRECDPMCVPGCFDAMPQHYCQRENFLPDRNGDPVQTARAESGRNL